LSNLNINTDADLLNRIQKGENAALAELYNRHWQLLFMSAFNIVKDKELCEDIIQDVFMSVWHNREKLEINISLKGYLYACTRYQVYYQIRKNKDKINVEFFNDLDNRLQYATPETELMHTELVQQINTIIETLPEKCKLVYLLSREEQFSHKEIAERLNISTKTVENHITKALQTIRFSLGNTLTTSMVLWLTNNFH
jgi:RNA polymerase sigma-70 factor (family 1)